MIDTPGIPYQQCPTCGSFDPVFALYVEGNHLCTSAFHDRYHIAVMELEFNPDAPDPLELPLYLKGDRL